MNVGCELYVLWCCGRLIFSGSIVNNLDQNLARRRLKGWLQEVSFGAEEDNAVSRRILAIAKANSR